MRKKIIAVLLIMVLSVSAFGGCGKSNDATSEPGNKGKGKQAPQKEAAQNFNKTGYPIVKEKTTFTAMHPHSPSKAAFDEMIYYQKLEKLSGIHMDWQPVPASDWETKVNLTLAGGDLPDIILGGLTNDALYDYGIKGDFIVNITDGIQKYMPNLQHWMKEYPDVVQSMTQLDGSMYFAPYIYDTAQAAADTVYVRKDMMKKAGVEKMPATVDEFHDMLKKFKDANFTPDFSPLMPTKGVELTTAGFAGWAYPAFGDLVDLGWGLDSDGKVEYTYINDQYKHYIEFISQLYAEGLVEPEIFTMDEPTNIAKMRENKSAVMTFATQLNPENFESGELEVEMMPPLTSEYTSKQKIRSVSHGGSGSGYITKSCKNVEAALRWFDMGYAVDDMEPGLNHLSSWLGIRGYNWDYGDDKKETIKYWNPEGMADKVGNMTVDEFRVYYIAPNEGPRAAVAWFVPESGPLKMKSEQSIKNYFPYTVDRFPDSALKFTDEENETIANQFTDIDTYFKQQVSKFIVGDEPMSKWDDYVKQIKKMGIDEVVKVYQASYDRLQKDSRAAGSSK